MWKNNPKITKLMMVNYIVDQMHFKDFAEDFAYGDYRLADFLGRASNKQLKKYLSRYSKEQLQEIISEYK